jgi:type II secretory pathway component GspD/PulD (secretin)
MGGAPRPAEKQAAAMAVVAVTPPPTVVQDTNQPSVLIVSQIYQMRDVEFGKIVAGLKFNAADAGGDPSWSASPEKFRQLTKNLESSGLHPITRPRIQTSSGKPAQMYVGDGTNGIEFDCTPFVVGGLVDLTIQGKVIDTPGKIAVTNQFIAKTSVENNGGIVIRVEKMDGSAESNLVVVTGVQFVTNLVAGGSPAKNPTEKTSRTMTFKLEHPVRQDELKEKLLVAGVKIPTTAYFYTDSGVLLVRGSEEQLARVNRLVLKLNGFSPKEIEADDKQFTKQTGAIGFEDSAATNLFERSFKVNTNTFPASLRKQTGLQTNSVSVMARNLFNKLGLDWESPKGKAVFFNDGLGRLFVRATEPDLDTIERAIQALNYTPPYVHIKARFVEVRQDDSKSPGFDWYLGQFNGSNNVAGKGGGSPSLTVPVSASNPPGVFPGNTTSSVVAPAVATITGILSEPNFRVVLHALQQRDGVESLAEPDVTTMSGRQTQMRATQIISVITNSTFQESATNSTIVPQMEQVETGSVLDTVAYVLSDGYTIHLTTIASVTEFLGYDKTTNSTVALNAAGEKVDLPVTLPRIDVRQASANLNLYDGQTVVLGKLRGEVTVGGKKVDARQNVEDKLVLVFITVTLVDPAGKRLHSDGELPFAKDGVPPQPRKPK